MNQPGGGLSTPFIAHRPNGIGTSVAFRSAKVAFYQPFAKRKTTINVRTLQVSGIWQAVWLEQVSKNHIQDLKISTSAEANHTTPRKGSHSLIRDLQKAGYEVAAFGKVAHGRDVANFGFDHVDRAKTLEQLEKQVATYLETRTTDKPLCLFVGTSNPHVSWTAETTFDPATVELPPHHVDTPSTRAQRAYAHLETDSQSSS